MCSYVPEIFGKKPFCMLHSTQLLPLRKANILFRSKDAKTFRKTGSTVIGLKFAGSSALSFLCISIVTACFQFMGRCRVSHMFWMRAGQSNRIVSMESASEQLLIYDQMGKDCRTFSSS